ncbi:MAG: hypothetical protein WC960_05235 [Bacteroidales bacterium]
MEKIGKKWNLPRVLLLISTLISAIILLLLSFNYSALLMLLISIVAVGLGLKRECYLPTGSRVKKSQFYFNIENKESLELAIKKGFKGGSPKVNLIESGAGKIEILVSRDNKYAQIELFRYVPYHYEKERETIIVAEEDIPSLCNYFKEVSGKKICQ